MSIDIKNKLSEQRHYRPEIDGLRAFAVVTLELLWGIINNFHKTKLSFIESMQRKIILDT